MPKTEKICESCRFYEKPTPNHTFGAGRCTNENVVRRGSRQFSAREFHSIDLSREICDKEHDGHFVYYEPKQPAAGAAAAASIRPQRALRRAAGGVI